MLDFPCSLLLSNLTTIKCLFKLPSSLFLLLFCFDMWTSILKILLSVVLSVQVEFCYLNSKANRKKLVRALFNVPRTSLELLPYYSRMVATLSTCMKDVSSMLLQMLEEEFNFLINKKVCFKRFMYILRLGVGSVLNCWFASSFFVLRFCWF